MTPGGMHTRERSRLGLVINLVCWTLSGRTRALCLLVHEPAALRCAGQGWAGLGWAGLDGVP